MAPDTTNLTTVLRERRYSHIVSGDTGEFNNGIAVAGWIHSALVVGEASAWLYWWYQASASNDNEGLVLKGSSTLTKRCYTLGNYSKFVRPGYVMVEVNGNSNTNVLLSAFTGTSNVTSSSDNLKAGTAVTVTGGAFTAALAATTVTTFVCK
jgi:O-glycosyl hydrolase